MSPRSDHADSDLHGASPCDEVRLSLLLRERTRGVHAEAERSGIIREILNGRADRDGYALLLRNLLPAYQALEAGLARHRETPGVARFFQPALFRAEALASDLSAISGPGWEHCLPLLPAGAGYGERVSAAAGEAGAGLIAHAYVRNLGDMSGGQVLRDLLAKSLGLEPSALSFYQFPLIADLAAFKAEYRQALDVAGDEVADRQAVAEEALVAFRLNIAVSQAVQAAAMGLR